ncbi:hypothetical protein [Salinigranum halophilum]|uniref:hypothetical protein n=1 Tax=Salinigranum halophilum TaxID=2565931 RepID=UPI0010A8C3FA|nr:hypothetical protein [Salinigranum halophilum]
MSSVTEKEARKGLFNALEADGTVSRGAFERNGEVLEFVGETLDVQGSIWIHREGIESVTKPPDLCGVCSPPEDVEGFEIASRGVSDPEADWYLRTHGIPYDDTSFLYPIEKSHRVIECSNCAGKGTIECHACGGDGEDVCRGCDGTGREEEQRACEVCSGEANPECTQCGGNGHVYIVEDCWSCNGTGTERCATCRGSGHDVCGDCLKSGVNHRYDGHRRQLSVEWTVVGLPQFWEEESSGSFSEILMELDWGTGVLEAKWEHDALVEVEMKSVEVGVLKLRYGDTEYFGMQMNCAGHEGFVFHPETGSIETSLRRKLGDVRRRLSPWNLF